MAKKQLDSRCSAKEAKKAREFTAWAWQSASEMAGKMSLEQYKQAEAEEKQLDELRQCGLTEKEIWLKSMSERGELPSKVHPHAMQSRLEDIKRKIGEKEKRIESRENRGHGVCLVSRRTLETEAVDFRCPKELKHLVQLKECDQSGVIDRAVDQTLKEERERVNRQRDELSGKQRDDTCEPSVKKDRQDNEENETELECSVEERPIRLVRCVSEEEIMNNKLTVEQIKRIPKFSNYSQGTASRVLYVKNLHRSVTESDLLPLFLHYQDSNNDKLVFRLLTGRMKGQAFVTFPTVDSAERALNLLNGYMFKEKPLIIQFGHRQT
jgi:hypothetical protein